MQKRWIAVILLMQMVAAYGGDGRIEISRIDVASPPYVITNAGSYVFTENVQVLVSNTNGIMVLADNVSIDLNGFTFSGPVPASDFGVGIYQDGAFNGLRVHNGVLSHWGSDEDERVIGGIYAPGKNNVMEDLGVRDCAGGVTVGQGGRIVNSSFLDITMRNAITAGDGAVISGCVSTGKSRTSGCIDGGVGATISDCAVSHSDDDAITAGAGSTVARCVVLDCEDGISVLSGSLIIDCASREMGGTGFYAGENCRVENCTSVGSRWAGIEVRSNCVVTACNVADNGHASASESYLGGIVMDSNGTLTDCLVSGSISNGIRVASNCTVRNNKCHENQGVGILVVGSHNRIDANELSSNGVGIETRGTNNVITRNSVRNSSLSGVPSGDYNFNGLPQFYGPIVSPAALITNQNPWVNFDL